jgi:hypothetical protein
MLVQSVCVAAGADVTREGHARADDRCEGHARAFSAFAAARRTVLATAHLTGPLVGCALASSLERRTPEHVTDF